MVTNGRNMGRVGTVTSRERHPGSFDVVHVKDSIGNLKSYSNAGWPSVSNLMATQTLNSIFESGVPISDALGQAQTDLNSAMREHIRRESDT